MKRTIVIFIQLAVINVCASAQTFITPNIDGWNLRYQVIDSVSVQLVNNIDPDSKENYASISCDTLRVPETVTWEGKSYNVNSIHREALTGCQHIRYVFLPNNITDIVGKDAVYKLKGWDCSVEGYIVNDNHPTLHTKDGVIYDKDMSKLLVYPSNKKDSIFIMPESVETITTFSMLQAYNLRYLETSLNLVTVEYIAIDANVDTVIFKDNLRELQIEGLIMNPGIKKIVFGNKVEKILSSIFIYSPRTVEIRTYIPPTVNFHASGGATPDMEYSSQCVLRVPRKSLTAYQQAEGWNEFGTIVPIEPPIVTGVDTASVSWVQNFSATGYMWTLYTDEAKTQRFMSLTFDANGHLTHIDINPDHVPARMPALYSEDGEEEKRFAEYYSFTISGLSPETRYYYTRQSMNGMEVIDEETGSFETLSSDVQGIEENNSIYPAPKKIIENGQVFIRSSKERYTLNGNGIKE